MLGSVHSFGRMIVKLSYNVHVHALGLAFNDYLCQIINHQTEV